MLKPLIPVITDWYSHEFNEIEHLSKVHAVYGSHHLQKELSANQDNDHNKMPGILKFQDEVSFHLSIIPFQYSFFANKIESKFCLMADNTLSFIPIPNQGPPPKFS